MKVLALLGSPRKGGNTEILLQAVLAGMAAAGGEIETVRLCEMDFQPCLNCGGCEKTGTCVLADDMTPLYDRLDAAGRIVLAAPIYFYNIPAHAKAFIDRTQSFWSRKRLLQKAGRWHEDPNRKGFLVSVAATHGRRVFDGAVLTMKYACDALGVVYGGDYLVRGIDRRGEMLKATAALAEARAAGERFMR